MKILNAVLLTLFGLLLSTAAQTKTTPITKTDSTAVKGSITVKVIADDGQPLEDVRIALIKLNTIGYGSPTLPTPTKLPDGRFRFDNLSAGVYGVRVSATAYVMVENETTDANRNLYRIGDDVLIRMTKGGVITGTVTEADGTPLVQAQVRVLRIRNQRGQKLSSPTTASPLSDVYTDDRGIYRIYGLWPGSYLVLVGGQQRFFSPSYIDPTAGSVPTYHPADTIDTAQEVTINPGQENSGIDIRFRPEGGHTLSGNITGVVKTGSRYGDNVTVSLIRAGSQINQMSTTVREENGRFTFKLEQIPDGEYQIRAGQLGEKGVEVASLPQKVTVKGSDISGLEIKLFPLSSVSGKIVLENNPALKNNPECSSKRTASPEEISLRMLSDQKIEQAETEIFSLLYPSLPDEKGGFAIRGMMPGKYHLTWQPPDETWFARSLKSADAKTDYGKNGFSLNSGASVNNIVLTVSNGAARLSGKIELTNKNAANAPEKFLVYLVPAEKEAADDVLRYTEVLTENDYSFTLKNLAPGSYFILAQPFQEDKEKPLTTRRPVFWNAETRNKIRAEAEAKKQSITLKLCQNLINQTIVVN